MTTGDRSRGRQVVGAFAIATSLVVIVLAFLEGSLHVVSKLGIVVLFGSNLPVLATAWVRYSLPVWKRVAILRFVGLAAGLVLLVAGAFLD
jgi:hypothetical protein